MSNNFYELFAEFRGQTGKGPSHRLRKAGQIPAIVYSGGKEATSIAVSPKDATRMLKGPLRRNQMIHLHLTDSTAGKALTKTVMVRDLQIDPVRRDLKHVDFIEVNPKLPMKVAIPLILIGKSTAVTTGGGKLDQIKRAIHVRVLPGEIPEKVELDVTDLKFGSTHASEVKLPSGVALEEDPLEAVVTIRIPKAEKEEAEATPVAGAAPAVAGAPAAGAAAGATPVAGAKPAAAAKPAKK